MAAAATATKSVGSAVSPLPAAAAMGERSECPPLPCNAALQREAAVFLAQEHAADASVAARSLTAHSSATGSRRDGNTSFLSELETGGERLSYPPSYFGPTAASSSARREKINPCTCSTAAFDGWLRAVVVSIPGPPDATQPPHGGDFGAARAEGMHSHRASTSQSTLAAAFVEGSSRKASMAAAVVLVSRERALHTALELLETAARLLQRRLALSHGQNSLLQAYYNALEEDIDATTTTGSELKPTAFHRELRSRKREVPLQHYSAEQKELEARLEKLYYVLRKLEEIEGLSNSILVEGREAVQNASAAADTLRLTQKGLHETSGHDAASDAGAPLTGDATADSPTYSFTNAVGGASSRRLVAIERRVRRLRRQLNLPLAPAEITSRLRNELILSFSARVLALREPAPFTPEMHAPKDSDTRNNDSSAMSAPPPSYQHRHAHSISAFVEWYVQHIMDPPAMSQLLSIVPHAYVVTTSCRLVYACEAHASLRASRALPDLGAVLLRAVTEGRADAMAQLVLSSSVSYGSVLTHPLNSPTCFYAGLMGGQLEVVARLVNQQCWDAEALHVLLFIGAPWGRASATRGCYNYQKTMLSRVWRVLQLAERGLQNIEQQQQQQDDDSNAAASSNAVSLDGEHEISTGSDSDVAVSAASADKSEDASSGSAAAAVAVAALRDAGLFSTASATSDDVTVLQTFRALFAAAASPFSSAAAQVESQLGSEDGLDGNDDSTAASPMTIHGGTQRSSFHDSDDSAIQAIGSVVSPGVVAPPPVFLDGGLQKLRLLLVARSGTLQYEAQQQDAQWAALLDQSARPVALRRRPSHGVNALAQDDTAARTAAAAAGVAAGDGNSSSISSESVFAAVLRRRQLDSLSPAAACPVRCQMCPAFSTPALQRVDALSYGPLQPTTSARAAAPVNDVVEGLGPVSSEEEEEADCAVDDDPKAASTDLGRAAKADSGGTERTQQQQRPVRALLVRADTAIEGAPHAWYAYWCSASPVVASAGRFGEVENGRQSTQDALSVASSRRPWRISLLRLQSRGSSRYSSTHAIEDSIQAALSAKQQRARRTLYGAAAGEVDSMADAKDDGGTGEDEAADEESGIIGASNSDVRGDVLRARSPLTALRGSARLSARSVYFEVHLSLNYLLALHDPAASLASSLVVNATRPVLSANSVVVGLCDDSVAVTANGCTRGPQQPFPVAHLGHSCDPGFVKAAASSEGKGATTTSTLGSAGVSVSVIAHRTRPHYSTEGSKSEEVYLAVSQHQGNSVSVVMADKDTPLYLRMEVPRYNRDAAAALTQAKDYQDGNPNIEMEAVTGALSGSVSVDDDGGAHQSCEATQSSPTYASPAATFLPNITIASPQDVQMAASTTQPSDATWHGLEASSLAVCPATIVMGLLYTPMSDALRLRVNNYVLPDELRLGMAAHAPTADTAAASNNRELNNHSSSNSMLRPCLYPAATLSLDEHGWERWYTHQTQMWTRARQQRPGSASAAMLPSAPAVSNAVVRFVFEAAHLLYGPPLTAVPPQGGALTAATSTAAVATRPAAHRRPRGTHVSLLDTACKFTQLLRVLTNVAALAGLTSSQQWQQTNLAATAATTTRHHSSDSDCEEAPPGFGEEGLGLGLAKSKVTSAAVPFFGSRDRLVRDALSGVQALLNAPAAEGALFYPPVRIYRHSSHCPPQDLYPLPPASKISMDGSKERDKVGADGKGTESNTKAEAAAATNLNSTSHASAAKPSPQPMRRQLGAGLAMQTAATSRLSWHEVLPENARLTPLCAALASRQPAMAYAIATHPLTSFCDSGNEAQNRTQQQQRRTALYAACALGYADVLAVLLERIPVEEILSFFGLVIEGEARAALQQSYAKAEALFLRNYRLNLLSTPVMTVSPSQPRDEAIKGGASNSSHRGGTSTRFASLAPFGAASGCDAAAAASGGGRFYGTNECQRALLDVSSIYSTTRTLYTPLHVALLGVIRTEDDDDDDDEDEDDGGDDKWSDDSDLSSGWEGSARDAGQQRFDDLPNVSAAYASSVQHLVRGLRRQTACTTLLLNCLYELLLTAPRAATTASGVSSGRVTLAENAAAVGRRPASPGCNGLGEDFATIGSPSDSNYEHAGTPTTTRYTEAGAELLASALNQQSRAGETALLLAVRHNNCRVATRLLRLGAQAACMDRVTHLFALELACANRCSPMAEALLRGPSSPYATSPVLLNHAGIATPLCWCAINNMPTVLQTLLRCDSVDVSAGFEGSTPLQLAITFGSEEAALALLSGTQPKTAAASTGDGTDRPKSHRAANVKGNDASNGGNSDNGGALQRSPPTAALPASTHLHQATNDNSSTTTADVAANEKPFMDVNVPHERTRCTALHLACERGQLHVVRALLQQWHAQLNVAAASTNYTPLLSALANGREDAALRILEYSKDELRRGRAVLDLTAIDQNGDTALHLAARHGLVLATEYMLAQFCEEEVTRLAQLHPQLRASPAFFTATCMVPLYAVNKQSKSALLVAIQYEQADAAEVLVSTFMDRQDGDDNVDNPDGDADNFIGRDEARKQGTSEGEENARANSRLRAHAESTTSSSVVQSAFAGPLIDGTCMALHQAFKKRLYTLVDLMLSAPTAARVFPASQAFRDAVQRRNEERRGNRVGLTRFGIGSDNNNRAEEDTDAQHSSAAAKVCAAGQNRSSFVRLLLTRAAGPAISPGAALRLLFRGFVLPELCVYLSDVAAESAVLGVQHGTAMAHAELLMGYLQEHARLVVAPTRMVSFCRDVWGCLQTWMRERAAQVQTQPQRQHPRGVEAETKKRKSIVSFHGGPTSTRCGTASPSTALRQRAEVKEEERRQEAPMVWLCCALLPTTATAASPESLRGCSAAASTATATATAAATAKSTTASLNAATSLASGEATTQSTDAARDRERRRKSEEVEAKKYGVALRSALDRKSLSLDVARAIRLYGSSAGGARAIEEIEGLVREFVTAKANAQARQMRQRLTSRTQPTTSPPPRTGVASKQSDTDREDGRSGRNEGDEGYAEAAFATACEPSALGSSLTDAATMMAVDEADVLKEVVGNEVLFTTPIGFTVLQLAAALGLSEVTAFLVERYHLDPLYAPSQDFYADAEIAATAEVTKSNNNNNNNNNSSSGAGMPQARVSTRASLVASASLPRHASLHAAMATAAIAASGRDEEEEQLRVLNCYTVRAMVRVVNASFAAGSARVSDTATSGKSSTRCASQPLVGYGDDGNGDGGGGNGSSWFYWTPYRLAVRTGNVDVVRTLLRTADGGGLLEEKRSAAGLLDRTEQEDDAGRDAGAEGGDASRFCSHRGRIVDFKEPQWVDPFQRTALQEQIAIVARSASSPSASYSSSMLGGSTGNDNNSQFASGPSGPAGMAAAESQTHGRATSTLAAVADMVALLLLYGAQPNGLFDIAGNDAWMLALTGSGAGGFIRAVASTGNDREGNRKIGALPSGGSGVESSLGLLLRFHTPLLGRAPTLTGKAPPSRGASLDAATHMSDSTLDEQLLRQRRTLLRKWKQLPCMRSSNNSATREKLALMKRRLVDAAEAAALDSVDEGGFVFDAAEALSEAYSKASPQETVSGPPSHVASSELEDFSTSNLHEPALTSFVSFSQRNSEAVVAAAGDNSSGAGRLLSPLEQAMSSSLLWRGGGGNPLSDGVPFQVRQADIETCKKKLVAALRLCYRVVLLFLCLDHAPQQLLRLLRVYTPDVIPVRARHPFSGDTVVTRLLRNARERLLTSGDTPTETEVNDMMSRVIDGVRQPNPCERGNPTHQTSADAAAAGQAFAPPDSWQRTYREATEDLGALTFIHTSLALIHFLRRLGNDGNGPTAASSAALECTTLQPLLFQPSFDGETPLSLAARLADVPLISAIVQSAAPPMTVDATADAQVNGNNERSSHGSQQPSQETHDREAAAAGDELVTTTSLSATSSAAAAAEAAASQSSSPPPCFSLTTNLTDVVVRVLLATRVYYPAHEIATVRILLHCMPNEAARLDFLRWVYPNIHPLPALQLAMDHVSVAAHFLTTAECMNALWTNLLYTRFTRQLDTEVRASSKAWNTLLKVVLPGAPAVPIYLILRGALRAKSDDAEGRFRLTEPEAGTTATAKPRDGRQSKNATLTNWSYLVRRTAIFLQLMSMNTAETLMSKLAGTSHAGSSLTSHLSVKMEAVIGGGGVGGGGGGGVGGVRQPLSNRSPLLDRINVAVEGSDAGAAGGSVGGSSGTPRPTCGLAGTLLLDTLELSVRYDDKEVLSLLMQLRIPEVVTHYVHQVQLQQQQQQQQAAGGSAFPVSFGVQSTNTRAIEAANTAILNSYPSFAGVRSMEQAVAVLDRLQLLLWREAIEERHLDLVAVLAGAARTLRSLYTSRQANVASLLTPMRYDRIDVKTGNPEGVISAMPLPQQQRQQQQPSSSMLLISLQCSPGTETLASVNPAVSPVEHLDATTNVKRFPHSTSSLIMVQRTPSESRTPSPPLAAAKTTPRSVAQQEDEEEQRFMDSCLHNGRLAPREERRRRVTLVTWGIGGSSCPVELPAGRGSTSAAAVDGALSQRNAEEKQQEDEGEADAEAAETTGAQEAVKCTTGGDDGGALARVSPPASLLSPAPPGLPPASLAASTALRDSDNVKKTSTSQQQPRKIGVVAQPHTTVSSKALVPTLHLPAAQPAASPRPAVDPVYFMYLQLDWAMFSTRLLQSPQPSTATIDTILFLLEHRCALSVPVLDLFLSGLIVTASRFVVDASPHAATPDREDSVRPRSNTATFSEAGEDAQTVTVELSLRYRTRHHRDTLLHLLVLHDQCQLAEYYLEYCYLFFVSHQIDPAPKNGRPGRFPIHELLPLRRQSAGYTRVSNSSNSNDVAAAFPSTPVAFLRTMLRVNAHGLAAFDYAHSPAMLQLLEWYGCVPPTYRPNPRLFRQVLLSGARSGGKNSCGRHHASSSSSEPGSAEEVAGWAFVADDSENDEDWEGRPHHEGHDNSIFGLEEGHDASDEGDSRQQQQLGSGLPCRKKREVLRFFPVPRLVLATDNFITLLDPTGTELASTVPQALLPSGSCSAGTTTAAGAVAARQERDDVDGKDGDDGPRNALQDQRPGRQQLRAQRHLAALITAEKKQLQLAWRRREQREAAKALLFEQVAMQPLLAARPSGTGSTAGKKGKSSQGTRGPANPPYLNPVITANLRQMWEAQRRPHISDNVLWHNALEAQRQSSLAVAARFGGGSGRLGRDDSRRGGAGGVLPILLSEEVSLLHLGLCAFDDELVSLYGELHASPHQSEKALHSPGGFSGGDCDGLGGPGGDKDGTQTPRPTTRAAAVNAIEASAPQAQLSAYNRMLLPPVLTGKATQLEQLEQTRKSTSSAKKQDAQRAKLGRHDAKLSISGLVTPMSTAAVAGGGSGAAVHGTCSTFSPAAAAPPPPPRLSHADVVFLLECQQFVVFPLALPSVVVDDDDNDDAPLEDGSRNADGSAMAAAAAAAAGVTGREAENQRGGLPVSYHGLHNAMAVIDRCTGGGGDVGRPGNARRRSRARSSTAASATAPSQPRPRGRSRAEAQQGPASDAPLLRAMLARQAATMYDLVDVTSRRYDTALLVSLTPMQLSGVVGNASGSGAGGKRGGSSTTMRALVERLASTQFKQFGSRLVSTASTGASLSSASSAAVTAAAHTTVETVALLCVPPFAATDTSALLPPTQRIAAGATAAPPSHQDTINQWGDAAATTTTTATAATTPALPNMPTVMAARLEEWVARHWTAQRRQPPKPKAEKKAEPAGEDGSSVGVHDLSLFPMLDRVAPVGGVATATQQTLMRALLRHFSVATGAQLSEQVGLSVAPNYDVAEVGDAAAARRDMATKNTASLSKKRR